MLTALKHFVELMTNRYFLSDTNVGYIGTTVISSRLPFLNLALKGIMRELVQSFSEIQLHCFHSVSLISQLDLPLESEVSVTGLFLVSAR